MFEQGEGAFSLEMVVSENVISGSLNTEVITEDATGCFKKNRSQFRCIESEFLWWGPRNLGFNQHTLSSDNSDRHKSLRTSDSDNIIQFQTIYFILHTPEDIEEVSILALDF